jgi:hypothetical protein
MYSKRFKIIFSFLLCVVLIIVTICYWKRCSNHSRLQFYLGEFEKGDKEFVTNKKRTLKSEGGEVEGDGPSIIYKDPLTRLLIACGFQHKYFYLKSGDNTIRQTRYALTKTRTWDDTKSTLLRCLAKDRHWLNYYNRPSDIPFETKQNTLIWRGTTTSTTKRLANRFTCVTKWFNKHRHIDVGFSSVSQGKNEYERFVKGNMSIQEMLGYKYILSIEGNDKDSGLNWKLNSNSLIFMAKPTIVSWLMEDRLIPNYHYILIDSEFCDLVERLEWCERNQSRCKQIIKNANDFMKVFKDEKNEVLLEKKVLTTYINNIN